MMHIDRLHDGPYADPEWAVNGQPMMCRMRFRDSLKRNAMVTPIDTRVDMLSSALAPILFI